MKASFHLRITAIFFLILIPLIYLYGYFRELEHKNEKVSYELIKEQILGEMNNFQEDLKPSIHIETAFKDYRQFTSGKDFEVDYESNYCLSRTGSPLQIIMNVNEAGRDLIIEYPKKVSGSM